MLLDMGFGDFNEIAFRQTIGVPQNWRGHQSVIVKRELAERPAWRQVCCGQSFAEVDQCSCVHPFDQGNEEAIERTYLGLTETTSIGQEQVRHLFQDLPLG